MHALANEIGGQLASARSHLQLGAVAELDDQRPCGHQRPSTLGDELKDRLEIGLPTQRPSDLDRRLERVDRLLQLPAVVLSARIAPGVVNRHPGELGQQQDGPFVLLAERLPAALVGQIQVAGRLTRNQDRNAQK